VAAGVEAALIGYLSLSAISLVAGFVRLRLGGRNPADPIALFCLGFSGYYGLANVWYCVEVAQPGLVALGGLAFDSGDSKDTSLLAETVLLSGCYLGCFLTGSSVAVRLPWVTAMSRAFGRAAVQIPVSLFLLWVLASARWLQLAGYPIWGSIQVPSVLPMVLSAGSLALIALLAFRASERPSVRSWLTITMVMSLTVLLGAALGMKETDVVPCFAFALGCVLARGMPKLPWVVALVPLVVIAFLGLSAWTYSNRQDLWQDTSSANRGVIDRVAVILGNATSRSESSDDDGFMRNNIARIAMAIPMMQTLELIDSGRGLSLREGVVQPLVPRTLWPDKPRVEIGAVIFERFTGQWGSSSSPGQPAEAFMYLGWPGVVLFGSAMGLMAGVVASVVGVLHRLRNVAAIGLLLPCIVPFLKCENFLYAYPADVLSAAVVLLAVLYTSSMFRSMRGSRATSSGKVAGCDSAI
jgi:hypothetical protein